MKVLAVLVSLFLLAPAPAMAQKSSDGLGGVLGDVLGGIFGVGGGRVHGHVVVSKGDTMVVRTDDGRTVSVDVAGTDPRVRGLLKTGDGVTLTMRAPREGEPRTDKLTASELQLDPPSQAAKSWHRVEGTVEEVDRSRVVFKTREGFKLPLDVSSIKSLPSLHRGEPATLVYEPGARRGVVAIWIEPGTGGAPAASIETSRTTPDALQRVHGLVDSVRVGGFTLLADDGRTLNVEMNRANPSGQSDVRPGQLVTVFGRPGDRPGVLSAEFIEPDPTRR
ncbi:MAG: hypothetical protein HYU41_16005 [Candidatus Rokubacteria bacterium]|nr:hypothetical protein [Candidatus Rokubacteria bacterium]